MGNTESHKKWLKKLRSLSKRKAKGKSNNIQSPELAENRVLTKGDLLEITGTTDQWVYVKLKKNKNKKIKLKKKRKMYINTQLAKPVVGVEAEQWYFGNISTLNQAKQCLKSGENGSGAFLVWKRAMNNHYYLSVKSGEAVKHYKINQGGFYLASTKNFLTISELVDSYSTDASGLCEKLNAPCVQPNNPPARSGWELERNSIEKQKKLDSGEFADVWTGVCNDGRAVAIKEFREKNTDFLNEVEIMKKLNHKRLLKLYGVCSHDEPVSIIVELMKNGSLYRYLRSHSMTKDIEFSKMMNFALQISEGMAYLESKQIVHRDIRADNILLDNLWSCKIADFGLAQDISSGAQKIQMNLKVPLKWMAPEIFSAKEYTVKCDVWSFGIVLTEIVTYGEEPYSDLDKMTCAKRVRRGYRMPKPENCPHFLYNIMLLCWKSNPVERPSFRELQTKLMAEIRTPAS